jgi:hypothetical protein
MKPRAVSLLLLALLAAASLYAWETFPRITTVEPDTGKAGDAIAAKGENLSKAAIAELYLTDGKNDTKLSIDEQSDTELKFKIPAAAKAGRYHLLVLTANKASMIEQPVIVNVE